MKAPDATSKIDVGTTVDRYEIVRHVARGGMGSVWLARFEGKHGFAKQVAIKTILPELANLPQFCAMFLEEARISSKLAHANVAQVLDVGEYEGAVYIVFEWVDGHSLAHLCRAAEDAGERIALPLLLRVLIDTCAGLHAVHELADADGRSLGVVHRDVTPGNVLVSDKGFAKVIDFGIAKARDRVSGETRSGFVKGTPQFMSPEAACKMPLDRRSDVWSIGAILHRALSGNPPFPDSTSLLDYIDGVSQLPPLPDSVPPALKSIVARALRVGADKRFATADEMRIALERALYSLPESATSDDQIRAEAGRLVSRLASSVRDVGAAHAPTELDVVASARPGALSSVPATRASSKSLAATVASAPAARSEPPATPGEARATKRGDGGPVRSLVLVVAAAAIVTIGAAALAFCG